MLSVHVGDGVDEAYAEAQRRGYEIVHPLTDEPWGVRRFFVRDPDGNVINMVSHRDDQPRGRLGAHPLEGGRVVKGPTFL